MSDLILIAEGLSAGEIINGLLANVDDHKEALRDAGLIHVGESPLDLSFQQILREIAEPYR